MNGFPSVLSTKKDYLNCLKLYPEETKAKLRSLLADRFYWVETKKLSKKEQGIEDEDHRIGVCIDGDGKETYFQLERREDKRARLFRLRFTVAEVEALIADN